MELNMCMYDMNRAEYNSVSFKWTCTNLKLMSPFPLSSLYLWCVFCVEGHICIQITIVLVALCQNGLQNA